MNNAQFANVSDFDSSKPDNFLYSVGDNTLKQPKKVRNISQDLEPNITAFDDLENKLLDLPEKEPLQINLGSIETSRR